MLIIQNYLQLIPMYILHTQNYASIIYTKTATPASNNRNIISITFGAHAYNFRAKMWRLAAIAGIGSLIFIGRVHRQWMRSLTLIWQEWGFIFHVSDNL